MLSVNDVVHVTFQNQKSFQTAVLAAWQLSVLSQLLTLGWSQPYKFSSLVVNKDLYRLKD